MTAHANFLAIAGIPFEELRASKSFADAAHLTLPTAGDLRPTLEVLSGNPQRVQSFYQAAEGRAIYLWGVARHPSGRRHDELLAWVAQQAVGDNPSCLRELVGHFLLIIDDR